VLLVAFVLVSLVLVVSTADRLHADDLGDCDDCSIAAATIDDAVMSESVALPPPGLPPGSLRFDLPLRKGRLAIPDVFRPPAHSRAI
jgi:hypothetical protein